MWAAALLLIVTACSTSNQAVTTKEQTEHDQVIEIQNPLTLADFLERVPGVNVSGYEVSIRGQGPPLFVIDGVQVGFGYHAAASSVNVHDIYSVEVLKGPETAIYGIRGQNGVIVIKTKGYRS